MLTYWCVLLSIVMVVGWMKLKDYVTIFSFSVKTENCKANHKWSRFAWKVCTVPPWFSQHVSKGEVPFAVTTPRLVSKYLQVNIKTFATVANWLATGGFLVKYLLFNQFHPTRATNFQEPLPASQGIHVSRASSGCITSKMVDNSWAIRKTSNQRPQEKSYRNPMFDYITFFFFFLFKISNVLCLRREDYLEYTNHLWLTSITCRLHIHLFSPAYPIKVTVGLESIPFPKANVQDTPWTVRQPIAGLSCDGHGYTNCWIAN